MAHQRHHHVTTDRQPSWCPCHRSASGCPWDRSADLAGERARAPGPFWSSNRVDDRGARLPRCPNGSQSSGTDVGTPTSV